jgi:tetratricopeptide (TPR) repeat protein
VSDLLIGLLSAALATNQAAAVSNIIQKQTGIIVTVPDKNDPVEREYQQLLEADDAAQEEADKWIKEEREKAEKGGTPNVALEARIKQRLDPIQKAYEDFLKRNPAHAKARVAYGSFLNDIHEEEAAVVQWEKAREVDPKLPSAWNNLANYYGHSGPVAKAFEYYGKAIELLPNEALYYENFATTVFLFRRDATNYYKITEQQVFEKAMALYHKAQELDPTNFVLATDVAQTYYGINLTRTGDEELDRKARRKLSEEALAAWQKALLLARDDVERQGVLIHFARVQINGSMFQEARKSLNAVTNDMFATTKRKLTEKLAKNSGAPTAPGAAATDKTKPNPKAGSDAK